MDKREAMGTADMAPRRACTCCKHERGYVNCAQVDCVRCHECGTECRFTFDYAEWFGGWADGTTWNGWDNVTVTPDTLARIVAYLEFEGEDAGVLAEMRALPVVDGVVSLANAYATKVSK